MATEVLTNTPTVLDPAGAGSIFVENTGSTRVTVSNGPQMTTVRPGRDVSIPIAGTVTAFVSPRDGASGAIRWDAGATARSDVVSYDELTTALAETASVEVENTLAWSLTTSVYSVVLSVPVVKAGRYRVRIVATGTNSGPKTGLQARMIGLVGDNGAFLLVGSDTADQSVETMVGLYTGTYPEVKTPATSGTYRALIDGEITWPAPGVVRVEVAVVNITGGTLFLTTGACRIRLQRIP